MIETGTDIENCGVRYTLISNISDKVAFSWIASFKLRDVNIGAGTASQVSWCGMLSTVWSDGVFVVVSTEPKAVAISKQKGRYYLYAAV